MTTRQCINITPLHNITIYNVKRLIFSHGNKITHMQQQTVILKHDLQS
jgi:hypothetical protein